MAVVKPNAAGSGTSWRWWRWWRSWRSWWARNDRSVFAAIVILAAATLCFRDLIQADWSRSTLLPNARAQTEGTSVERAALYLVAADMRFVTWLLSRNARTLTTQPGALFDAGICFPVPRSLALGEHALTLSGLGIPAWLLSGDPFVVVNSVLVLLPLLSAWLMYWIIREWTGEPLGGLVAALAYAFAQVKIGDSAHPYLTDTIWTLSAIFFYRRWLQTGRWRDVSGLALSIAAQLGGSVYPLVGATILGVVFALGSFRPLLERHTRPAQWLALLAFGGGVAYLVLAPFVAQSTAGVLTDRPAQFLHWGQVLPGTPGGPGWLTLALAAAAMIPGRRWLGPGDHALAVPLLVGAGLVLLVAAGGNEAHLIAAIARGEPLPPVFPNPFDWLAAVVPGLGAVRAPLVISTTAHLAVCALAGLGAGRILRRLPPRAAAATGVGAVAVTFAGVVGIGPAEPPNFGVIDLHPGEDAIEYFEALREKGNTGPLLELPVRRSGLQEESGSILLAAYHHRPTSRCYNSFHGREVKETRADAARLPDPEALERLRSRGFTTVLLDHPRSTPRSRALRRRLGRADGLELIHMTAARTAWSIVPVDRDSAEPVAGRVGSAGAAGRAP